MKITLWHAPYNGGWIWFDRANLRRCEIGWRHENWLLWWAIFGFSGGLKIQSWPWQKNPSKRRIGEKEAEMSDHLEHLKFMAKVRPAGADRDAAQWAVEEIESLRRQFFGE